MLPALVLFALCGGLVSGGCRDTLAPFDRLQGTPPARLVTVSDTLFPEADSYIRQLEPNRNWGADTALQLGGGGKSRVLVRFDSTALRQAVGAGTLDSAWLEFTITAGPSGWGQNERTVDLHRLKRTWTELGATWNCAVDANTANSVTDCPTESWDMTNNGNGTYHAVRTDRVTINNGQTGLIRLNVTADVQGYLAGSFLSRGWVFRKTGETLGGEAVVFSRESGSQPRLLVYVAGIDTTRPPVPALGYPQDSLYLVRGIIDTSVMFYRRLAIVKFEDSTSGLTVRAFLTSFAATIVGGGPPMGEYVVQFPDGGPTLAAFKATLDSMGTFTGVRYVRPAAFRSPAPILHSRFPDDGPGHKRPDWIAGNGLWAQRAVRAHLAWSCENGQYSANQVKIGVLEWDFMASHPDIQAPHGIFRPQSLANAPLGTGLDQEALSWHGTAVAGVLGATADNDTAVAGMMWSSDLHLYALGSPGTGTGKVMQDNISAFVWEVLPRIGADGLRVLNISMELPRFSDEVGGSQTVLVDGFRELLENHPDLLIVKSVGNALTTLDPTQLDSLPSLALLSALSLLRRESSAFADRIIFVAGTEDNAGDSNVGNVFWSEGAGVGSNFVNGQTDIAAPAAKVDLLGGSASPPFSGEIVDTNGTSFAAPMVAGVAAQLMTMLPSLTPAEVKNFILRGAREIPRLNPATGLMEAPNAVSAAPEMIYQLDAYGALTLMSRERVGAPVCGYDVRFENGAVVLAPPGGVRTPYQLFPSFTDGSVSVAQGGRRIAVSNSIYISDPTTPRGVTVIDHLGNVIHTIANVTRRLYLERDTADIRYVQPQDTVWLTGRPLLDLWGPGRTSADRDLNVLGPFEHGVHDFFSGSWIEVSPAGDYIAALMSDRTYVTCVISGGQFTSVLDHSDLRLIPLDGSTPTTVRTSTFDECARVGNPPPNDDYSGADQVAFSHDSRRAVFSAAFIDPDPLAQGNDVIRSRLYNYVLAPGTATTTVVQDRYVFGPRFEADDAVFLTYDFDGVHGGPCLAVSRQAASLGSTVGSPQSAPVSECLLVQGNVTRGNLRASRQPATPGSRPSRIGAWPGFSQVRH